MKDRIDKLFAGLAAKGKKGLIAYLTAGDPNLDATVDYVLRLEDAGADLVELGVPFSDPLADGPVNQEAAMRALAAGATYGGILDAVARLRERTQLPIIFFSYMNPLHALGFDAACERAARAGVDGMLVLDLPLEEGGPYRPTLERNGLAHVALVTPTSSDERLAAIVAQASGFLYCVSRTGVTGMQRSMEDDAQQVVERARRHTTLPLALGFGISDARQAAQAAAFADAIIVGSAIVKRFHEEGPVKAARWVAGLSRAVKGV